MGFRRRGVKGIFLFEWRVPRRFRDVESREFIRLSLGTDNRDLAKAKHDQNKTLLTRKWEALRAGRDEDAEAYQAAIVELCRASGFEYLPAAAVAELPLSGIYERVVSIEDGDTAKADAVLGGALKVPLPVSKLLETFEKVVEAELTGKNEKQLRKWRNDRSLVVAEFKEVAGDKDVADVSRDDVARYRAALSRRIVAGELVRNSTNRRIQALGKMVNTVLWNRRGVRTDAFKEMGWREPKQKRRNTQVSYSPAFIRDKLLEPGALDRLNEDARDIIMAAINTGAGPSELVNLNSKTIHLDEDIPYIEILPEKRELKNVYRERRIPLVGVSLAAFERHPGGFRRYTDGDSVSSLINKYFRNNGLKETEDHTLKSLRHSFRDALRNAGCPDSIAEELMGHVQEGTVYGEGVWLDVAQEWLNKIAY